MILTSGLRLFVFFTAEVSTVGTSFFCVLTGEVQLTDYRASILKDDDYKNCEDDEEGNLVWNRNFAKIIPEILNINENQKWNSAVAS